MTYRRDVHGYYSVLGLTPSATAEEIRRAFRQKAKDLHPDRNPSADAKTLFQRVNEAHRTLSNESSRARYDALRTDMEDEDGAQSAGGPSSFTRRRPAAMMEPVVCTCGTITAQPRFVYFWQVTGLLVRTRRTRLEGIFCRSCADRTAVQASMKTWALGWWAFPRGPIDSVEALFRNMMGGDMPAAENLQLLWRQANYFAQDGNATLARACLEQASRFARDPQDKARLQTFYRQLGRTEKRQRLVDRWGPGITPAFLIQLAPLLLVIGLILFSLFGPSLHSLVAPPPRGTRSEWIERPPVQASIMQANAAELPAAALEMTQEPTPLLEEPALTALRRAELPPFVPVQRLSPRAVGGFVHVQLPSGAAGYVEERRLRPVASEELTAFCTRAELRPADPSAAAFAPGSGRYRVDLANGVERDLVVDLLDGDGVAVLRQFIAGNSRRLLPPLPAGDFRLALMTGTTWSPQCGIFLADHRRDRATAHLRFPALSPTDPDPAPLQLALQSEDGAVAVLREVR